MSYYSYQELHDAVVENETPENINALGEWFSAYGERYWNGECYDADEFQLYPVYREMEGCEDQFEIIGYEIR